MIRVAHYDDLAGVLRLYQELRPHDPVLEKGLAQERWRQIIDDPQTQIVVADFDGELAATCALSINRSIANGARPFGIIEHVITASAYRRRGLSRQVLEFALVLAWQRDCYKVMLLSGEQLTAAHSVYESVGFKSGIEKGFVIKPSRFNDT
ncbi:GNAT family N-acetyltransferase [Chitinibacter bivalviorum]|uniref:GNAT family N-acetyltransferase n=1 Tax=Chitinibacter bivalviorum TaxID=2739434 RepID=A0A7H9BHT1_9NEIS|nr:GNAT family N-acetyltransferase [Chitinibacter bivalviorum]QLG88280.1 GNAT family N-acetyltransferase [Chitinibacter bivalviorum]